MWVDWFLWVCWVGWVGWVLDLVDRLLCGFGLDLEVVLDDIVVVLLWVGDVG